MKIIWNCNIYIYTAEKKEIIYLIFLYLIFFPNIMQPYSCNYCTTIAWLQIIIIMENFVEKLLPWEWLITEPFPSVNSDLKREHVQCICMISVLLVQFNSVSIGNFPSRVPGDLWLLSIYCSQLMKWQFEPFSTSAFSPSANTLNVLQLSCFTETETELPVELYGFFLQDVKSKGFL